LKEKHKTFKNQNNMNFFKTIVLVFIVSLFSCNTRIEAQQSSDSDELKQQINSNLNTWHKAAAEANFTNYFELMTKDAVFIGTDATENWQIDDFKAFCKPYFDKGRAWNFTAIERNIYLSEDKIYAWFDELLDTQMKICRGSGIMRLENDKWKVAHYVLSITIPNENVSEVTQMKKEFDSLFTKNLMQKNKN